MESKSFRLQELENAVACFRAGQMSEAEEILNGLLNGRDPHPDAAHLLGILQCQSGRHDIAKGTILTAISLSPNNSNYYNTLGIILRKCGEIGDAKRCFDKAIQLKPNYADALYNRAGISYHQGDLKEALLLYQSVVKIKPHFAEAWNNMAATLNSMERYDEASYCCRRALTLKPGYCEALNNLGNAAASQGKPKLAITFYQEAIGKGCKNAELLCNLANALVSEGCLESAIDSYKEAIGIDHSYGKAYNNLGTIYRSQRKIKKAAIEFRRCIELNPDDPEPYHNMANLYLDKDDFRTAALWYDKALSINPQLANSLLNRGIIYQETGQSDEAIKCFKKVLENNPQNSKALCHLAHELYHRCDWSDVRAIDQQISELTVAELDRGESPSEMPFLSLIRTSDPKIHFRIAKKWSDAISNKFIFDSLIKRFDDGRTAKDKITIGYLSNNFRNHPTAHLTWQLFDLHNRDRFRVNVYSYGENDNGPYRHRIEQTADQFVDLSELDHRTAAEKIRDDRVDILVDLVGFMRAHRLEICSHRPSPIQVRWLGQAGTTGASFFDYIITDRIVTPESEQSTYSETFAFMPDTYQVNSKPLGLSQTPFCRYDLGLPEHGIVYCCFCSSYKIDERVFQLWMQILKAVPDSVLWLIRGNNAVVENLQRYASACDVSPERLVFSAKTSKANHLRRLALADLALDTTAVNGAATTSDALWAGVPVLTLKGSHFASRMSSSILNAIRLNELSVYTEEAYVQTAVKLGRDSSRLNTLKAKLKVNRITMPLFNPSLFVKNLEFVFEGMWRDCLSAKKSGLI